MTRGGLCVKLKNFAEHHYNPDRLLYPMKRVGPKGSGQFERISWDDALAHIKQQWTEIIAKYGSQAIMPHAYLGHQGTLNGRTRRRRVLQPPRPDSGREDLLRVGLVDRLIMTVGPTGGLDVESLALSKYIIVWGMNMLNTNPRVAVHPQAKAKGAKIVVIDPVARALPNRRTGTYASSPEPMARWHSA